MAKESEKQLHVHVYGASPMAQCKESTFNAGDAGDPGSIPGLVRSPGEGNGNPLQYSCLGRFLQYRGAWWATVHGVARSRIQLSNSTTTRAAPDS